MKYSEVPEGAIFFIEGIYEYPKRKVGKGHIDIRDGCKNTSGNPDWDVVTATRIAQLEAQLAEAVEVIKSGQALVLKMFEAYDDTQYQTAFHLLADMQGEYTGVKWTKEQDEFTARAAEFLNQEVTG